MATDEQKSEEQPKATGAEENPTSSSPQEGTEGTYLHLMGRALIGKDSNGNFTVTLLDEKRQPFAGSIPITFSERPFELINMHLVAEFMPTELETYRPTLEAAKFVFKAFKEHEVFQTCMQTTDPPCTNIVQQPSDNPPIFAPPRTGNI